MEKNNPLNKKLYVARDIEGEQNTESIKVLRELEERFKKYDWFVGVALMGSTTRGYNIDGSDIDCKMVYDSSRTSRSEVIKVTRLNVQEVEQGHNFKTGQISLSYLAGFDIKKIKKGLQENEGADYTDTLLTLKDLSGVVVGEKVDKYRTIVKEILSKLSSEKREEILDKIVDFSIQEERLSEQKLSKRLGISGDDLEKLWVERRKLWKNRVSKIWI